MGHSSVQPEPFVIHPTAPHTHTLILLHGTQQTGPSFAEEFRASFSLCQPRQSDSSQADPSDQTQAAKQTTLEKCFPGCKFVFLTGATRKITLFPGKELNSWFDITDFGDRTLGEDKMKEGMHQNILYISSMIKAEVELLYGETGNRTEGPGSAGKVMLAGLSQGCAMGILLLLSGQIEASGILHGFGGFIGLSGWLGFRRQINERISEISDASEPTADDILARREGATSYLRDLLYLDSPGEKWTVSTKGLDKPVFLGHGEADMKAKYVWAKEMRDVLQRLNLNLSFNSYAGVGHTWNDQEMNDIVNFMEKTWGVSRSLD